MVYYLEVSGRAVNIKDGNFRAELDVVKAGDNPPDFDFMVFDMSGGEKHLVKEITLNLAELKALNTILGRMKVPED